MATKFSLTAALALVATLGLGPVANAQTVTDVLVQDGAGNTIADNVRSFDENEAGSGLAIGFTPVVGSTFTFLYQANVVSFNDAAGQTIMPLAGLNASFASGGYEFTVVASITETVTSVIGRTAGSPRSRSKRRAARRRSSSTAPLGGGAQSVTSTGVGFDDGTLVGQFDVVSGAGISTFVTFANGAGLGATQYEFVISPGTSVDADYISGLSGPIGDLHFTSSQVLPPGTSLTTGFHLGTPSQCPRPLRDDRGRRQPAAEGRRFQCLHHRHPGAGDLCAHARRPGRDRLHDASAQEVVDSQKQEGPALLGLFLWDPGAVSAPKTGLSPPADETGPSGLLPGPRLIADPAILERRTALLLNRERQPGRQHAHRSGVAEPVQPSIPADESHRAIVRKILPNAIGRRAIDG